MEGLDNKNTTKSFQIIITLIITVQNKQTVGPSKKSGHCHRVFKTFILKTKPSGHDWTLLNKQNWQMARLTWQIKQAEWVLIAVLFYQVLRRFASSIRSTVETVPFEWESRIRAPKPVERGNQKLCESRKTALMKDKCTRAGSWVHAVGHVTCEAGHVTRVKGLRSERRSFHQRY